MIKTIILVSVILIGSIITRKEIKAVFDAAGERDYIDLKKIDILYKRKKGYFF